ncbi:Uncharacterized protein K02A2.6 [Toxocara canis]|uniref:Uncharacterized protein K02A2.6 n=1 Tax=Toxocara canis TaxID=6265 RepID=A0A0B2V8X0_TOXCA|nr:Uncharacterized protein K02A2.6 [Toxocara canis]
MLFPLIFCIRVYGLRYSRKRYLFRLAVKFLTHLCAYEAMNMLMLEGIHMMLLFYAVTHSAHMNDIPFSDEAILYYNQTIHKDNTTENATMDGRHSLKTTANKVPPRTKGKVKAKYYRHICFFERHQQKYLKWKTRPIRDDDQKRCEERQDCTHCEAPIVLATCGTILIVALFTALVIDDLREQGAACFEKEENNIFLTASQFEHKGPLRINAFEEFHLEPVTEEEETANTKCDQRFTFSTHRHEARATLLFAYDFTIEYRKTSDFGQADAHASGLQATRTRRRGRHARLQTDFDFNRITENMPLTHKTLRSETEKDEILQAAISHTSSSWPDIKQLPKLPTWLELVLYHRNRNVLTVAQGCLMFADRVTVPRTLCPKVLKSHPGHPGTTRMVSLAREWPLLDRDIEGLVSQCSTCALAAKNPVKAELHSRPRTTKP